MATEDQQHHATAIKNMTEMYQTTMFSDVTIKCGSLIFTGHRIVLAAHSPYLKAKFIHDMKDGENAPLEITAPLDPNATEQILQYMYTGQINLDENTKNVQNAENVKNIQLELILEAADYMQVLPVVKLCSDKLLASLSPQKFLQQWQTFEKYCMTQHKDSLVNYLSERFYRVQTSDEYLQIPHQFVRELIQNQHFPLSNDETVLALLNWTKKEPEARIPQLNLLLDNIHYSNMSPAFIIKFFEDPLCWQIPKLQKMIGCAAVEKWWKRTEHTAVMNIAEEVISCEFFDHRAERWLPSKDFATPEQFKRDNIMYVFAHGNNIYFFTAEKLHCLDVETKTWTNYCPFPADKAEPFCFHAIFCGAYLYVFEPHNFRRLNVESCGKGWEKIATLTEYEANRFLAVEFEGTVYIINKTLQNSRSTMSTSTLSVCSYDCEAKEWIPQSIELSGTSSSCVHLCVATAERIYLMDNSNKLIYICERKNQKWVVSMITVEVEGLDAISVKSLFYNFTDNSLHLCQNDGMMDVCSKDDSYSAESDSADSDSVVDTANRCIKLGNYYCYCASDNPCEMLEDDIDYILRLNLCL